MNPRNTLLSCITGVLAIHTLLGSFDNSLAFAQEHPSHRPEWSGRVKAFAVASKPTGSGLQIIDVTLRIDNGWYLVANPSDCQDLVPLQTTLTIVGKATPRK